MAASSGVSIDVVDNGPGVSPQDLPHIFERGYTGRQACVSGIPGSGLGLGIARDMMRSMGGEVKVENRKEDGWGARATLFMPEKAVAKQLGDESLTGYSAL